MSSKEIANQIKKIIDDMWAQEITNQDALDQIKIILSSRENKLKVIRGSEKTAVFIRVMGVKRLKSFDELLNEMNI